VFVLNVLPLIPSCPLSNITKFLSFIYDSIVFTRTVFVINCQDLNPYNLFRQNKESLSWRVSKYILNETLPLTSSRIMSLTRDITEHLVQVSISSMFYEQLFCLQIPKAQKSCLTFTVFFALLVSVCVKAARRTLMKLTLGFAFRLTSKFL